MNISHKHKIIWWAPERCGTKATAHVFNQFDFTYYETSDENTLSLNKDGTLYQSHNIEYPEKYSDYKVICSIRNPYDRVLSIFLNFTSVGKYSVYTKSGHNNFVKKYEQFIKELFDYKLLRNKVNRQPEEGKVILKDYLSKYDFTQRIPDKIIRMEHLVEDIGDLDFIRNSDIWESGEIREYLNNNVHHNIRPCQFNTIYTKESAKMVYDYYKKHFLYFGYDPFSFTKEELTNEEKMHFLHGIL